MIPENRIAAYLIVDHTNLCRHEGVLAWCILLITFHGESRILDTAYIAPAEHYGGLQLPAPSFKNVGPSLSPTPVAKHEAFAFPKDFLTIYPRSIRVYKVLRI